MVHILGCHQQKITLKTQLNIIYGAHVLRCHPAKDHPGNNGKCYWWCTFLDVIQKKITLETVINATDGVHVLECHPVKDHPENNGKHYWWCTFLDVNPWKITLETMVNVMSDESFHCSWTSTSKDHPDTTHWQRDFPLLFNRWWYQSVLTL